MDEDLPLGSKIVVPSLPNLGSGFIRFVGKTEFYTGIWVGVELENAGMLEWRREGGDHYHLMLYVRFIMKRVETMEQ